MYGTWVEYHPGANGSVMCQCQFNVYVVLPYMKDILLSGRFVKGDLRGVSDACFTHYGAVDDSSSQLHSLQKNQWPRNRLNARGDAPVYIRFTPRGAMGLFQLIMTWLVSVEPQLLATLTRQIEIQGE
jgi:hypothetical protein